VAALAAVLIPAGGATAAKTTAGPPTDYTKLKGLSQPVFTKGEITRDELRVPMKDGTELYVEVVRPKAEGRYPTTGTALASCRARRTTRASSSG
jgi:predicted acyl esterase